MARALELAPSRSSAALRTAKRRFREFFPRGFADPTYLEWERGYKWEAHLAWRNALDRETWSQLLAAREYREIGGRIARWYARSHLNMLALYEWMGRRRAREGGGGGAGVAAA